MMRTRADVVTVPEMVKLKGFSSASLLPQDNCPRYVPDPVASSRTVKVVEAPGARLVLLVQPEVTVKPDDTLTGAYKVRPAVPRLRTVKVRLTGVPTGVVPKLTAPALSAMLLLPSSTWI